MYMADLLVIGGKLPVNSTPRPNIPGWSQIVTPMSAEVWGRQLASHQDVSFREYLVEGLRCGFRISFSHDSVRCMSAVANMSSAAERPSVNLLSSLSPLSWLLEGYWDQWSQTAPTPFT